MAQAEPFYLHAFDYLHKSYHLEPRPRALFCPQTLTCHPFIEAAHPLIALPSSFYPQRTFVIISPCTSTWSTASSKLTLDNPGYIYLEELIDNGTVTGEDLVADVWDKYREFRSYELKNFRTCYNSIFDARTITYSRKPDAFALMSKFLHYTCQLWLLKCAR